VTLEGHSYGENGGKLGFSTFSDLSVIRPKFLEVSLATKRVELGKLHRNVHFPTCLGPIPDGDSFREMGF
jgi:hypothetical protein